ncbi:unnamed protein product [Closterium sp. NIES-64]|nr:unnamed protein product [Closterium sp. NIES-64]
MQSSSSSGLAFLSLAAHCSTHAVPFSCSRASPSLLQFFLPTFCFSWRVCEWGRVFNGTTLFHSDACPAPSDLPSPATNPNNHHLTNDDQEQNHQQQQQQVGAQASLPRPNLHLPLAVKPYSLLPPPSSLLPFLSLYPSPSHRHALTPTPCTCNSLFQLSLFFRPHSNVRFPPVTFDRAFLLPSPVTPSFLRSVHEADANGAAAAGGAGDDWAVVWGKWPGGGTAQELADLHVALVEAHLVTVKRTFNRARVFVAPHARCSTTWSSCRPVP